MISIPQRFPETQGGMEISEGSSRAFRIRMWNTAPDAGQSCRSRGQVLAGTFPQPACCVACTSRRQLQLPPRRLDEFGQIRPSPLQPSPETAAGILPWDELNGSTVDLLKTAIDLVPPGFFDAIVDCVIETLDQRIDQGGPN